MSDIVWTTAPDPEDFSKTLDLIRAPETGKIRGWITSRINLGCYVHWFGNRTVPHTEKDCAPCLANRGYRWRGYFGAMILPHYKHVIIEYTPQVHDVIEDYVNNNNILRGAAFALSRKKKKANAPVVLALLKGQPPQMPLHAPPDLELHLNRIWDVGRMKKVDGDVATDTEEFRALHKKRE